LFLLRTIVVVMCEQSFKCTAETTTKETTDYIMSAYTSKTVWRHHTGVCGGNLYHWSLPYSFIWVHCCVL